MITAETVRTRMRGTLSRRTSRAGVALCLVAGSCAGPPAAQVRSSPSSSPPPVTLTVMGTPLTETRSARLRQAIADQFANETGIHVTFVPGMIEASSSELEKDRQLLASGAATPDIYQIDMVWSGMLAEHLLDLTPYLAGEGGGHLQGLGDRAVIDGRLVGVSYFVDVGLLYSRTDLLRKYGYGQPPATWDALEAAAAKIQAGERAAGRKDFWGFVWQGAAYEGLTCNALEWQVSHGGGRIIEADGTVSVSNRGAVEALERAAGWIGRISPPGVIAYHEEDARNVWQSGNAAFMRNWPYAYALGQAADSTIRDAFEISLLPAASGPRAAALGGWQLAVSRYTKHPREAGAFVRFMRRRDVQRQRFVEGTYLPTVPELYLDPGVLEAHPQYARLSDALRIGVTRPSAVAGAAYDDVSRAYYTQVHSILTGRTPAAGGLRALEARLVALGFRAGPP